MKVTLLNHTPLWIAAKAIRTAWDSHDKSDTKKIEIDYALDDPADFHKDGMVVIGEKDKELIDRVGNKLSHSSTLEHLSYVFEIKGVSRALLQEIVRHRISSFTVKSTRYTLKELKKEKPFMEHGHLTEEGFAKSEKYLVMTGNIYVDTASMQALGELQGLLFMGISNDIAKYCLPEALKTELVWTANARSIQNFLTLRSDKSALWEIRDLARAVFEAIPDDHKYLFEHCMKDN